MIFKIVYIIGCVLFVFFIFMPTKSTKITKKSDSEILDVVWMRSWSKSVWKKVDSNNSSAKKVVLKRRKTDLIPTKASAVAIVSQANRAKKKALIEKFASEDNVDVKVSWKSSTKIPLWVWIFFGCSLLLFCISFYQAIIRPQIEKQIVNVWTGDNFVKWDENIVENDLQTVDLGSVSDSVSKSQELNNPVTAEEVINEFFDRLSSKQFDEAFSMFTPTLQKSSEILEHFTSFRMDPFVSWIEWGRLSVSNIQFVGKSSNWRDRYKFNLSYLLNSNNERYDEEWEFLLDTSWDIVKIASILCATSKCSYHPIFWPENFGLMK